MPEENVHDSFNYRIDHRCDVGYRLAHFAQSTLVTDTREAQEDWVHPNLVRVQLNGDWHEFPLVELMDPKCRQASPATPGCE